MAFLLLLTSLALVSGLWASACASRDCSEERAGQQRCLGNRLEICNADGSVEYQACAQQGLVCSNVHGACVTPEVAMTTSSSGMGGDGGGGNGGDGGMSAGGMGGDTGGGGTGGDTGGGGMGGNTGGGGAGGMP